MDVQEPGISPYTEVELPEGIVSLKPLTIEQICQREDIEKGQLPEKIREGTQRVIRHIEEKPFIVDTDGDPFYDILYGSYLATRNLSPDDPLFEFSQTLNSFDSFIKEYAPDISTDTRSNLVQRMSGFIDYVVHPEEIVYLSQRDSELRKGYNYGGKSWIYLTNAERPEYTTREVIEEIVELEKEGAPNASYWHATGSASLPGIERHKAVLSSSRAQEVGEDVMTGEHNGMGKGRLLGNIYVNQAGLSRGYSLSRWFDEYSVVIGISKEKLAKYFQEKGEKWEAVDLRGEGTTIGPEVPLQAVDVLYSQREYLPRLNEWAQRNCPHAKVVSLEAYELMRQNANRKAGLDIFGVKPIEDWPALLNS